MYKLPFNKQTFRGFHRCSLNSLSTANPYRCWYCQNCSILSLWHQYPQSPLKGCWVTHCNVRDSDNRADVWGSVGWLWDFAELWEYWPGWGPPDSDHHQPQRWGTPPNCSPHQHRGNPAVCHATGPCWCWDPGQETTSSGKASGEEGGERQ